MYRAECFLRLLGLQLVVLVLLCSLGLPDVAAHEPALHLLQVLASCRSPEEDCCRQLQSRMVGLESVCLRDKAA